MRGGTAAQSRGDSLPWSGYGRESPTALKITQTPYAQAGSFGVTGAREAAADRLRGHPGRTRVPKMTDKATRSPEDLADTAAAQLAVRAEPPRARCGRHRHGQDQDAPADGRAALRPGRPGLPRRHQGRPVR